MSGRDALCSLALQSYRSQTANVLAVGSAALVSIHILTFYPSEHTPGFGFCEGIQSLSRKRCQKQTAKQPWIWLRRWVWSDVSHNVTSRLKSSCFKTSLSRQMENTLQRLQGRFQTMSQELESKNILLLVPTVTLFSKLQVQIHARQFGLLEQTVHEVMLLLLWLMATTSGCSKILIKPTWLLFVVLLR